MSDASPAPKGLLLKGEIIGAPFLSEIQQSLAARPRPPKLVGILATSSAPSRSYAEFTRKQCEALGVHFVLREIAAAADPTRADGDGAEEAIIEANEDKSVDGIMVRSLSLSYRLRSIMPVC
jgi:methylenetetrahydrofolate dehydrogenase (NAD+)